MATAPAQRVRDYLNIELPGDMLTYKAIRAAAAAGLPCPTCDDLIEATDATCVSQTVQSIQRLEQKYGLIKVERYHKERRVYVKEIDRWTREPSNKTEPWYYASVTIGDLRKIDPDLAINVAERAERLGISKKAAMLELAMAGAAALAMIQPQMAEA